MILRQSRVEAEEMTAEDGKKINSEINNSYRHGVYIDNPVYARCDLNDDNDFADTGEQFYSLNNPQHSVHALTDTSGNIIEVYKNYQPYGAVDIYTGDAGDSEWNEWIAESAMPVYETRMTANETGEMVPERVVIGCKVTYRKHRCSEKVDVTVEFTCKEERRKWEKSLAVN